MDQETFSEMLSVIQDFADGCAFYHWFVTKQGLKFKGQYFISTLRGLAFDLVEAIVKNGGEGTLEMSIFDRFSYCQIYMSEPPVDCRDRISKFLTHGIELVPYEQARNYQNNAVALEAE